MAESWLASHLGALQFGPWDRKLVLRKLKKNAPLGTSPASHESEQ